jgi:predicted nucleic acid-binding Zn ribbon protein
VPGDSGASSARDPREPGPATPGGSEHAEARGGHDPSGLDLARSVARAMGRGTRSGGGRGEAGTARGGVLRRRRRRAEAQSSGAYPDDRDPQTLDATIGRLVSERGWSTDVAVHGVFSRWDTIVGREVAEHCHPERFAEAKLTVRADSTAWATQVRLLAPTVVRRLNEELGDGTVTAIDVKGPHVPSWSKGFRSVRDGRGPRDTYG